jgi:superfamily II DNA helicase RecQ
VQLCAVETVAAKHEENFVKAEEEPEFTTEEEETLGITSAFGMKIDKEG